MKIESGEVVIAVLHSPREKIVGVLEDVGPAGIHIRAVDLSYFEDWMRSIVAGEPHLSMTDYFFPMWRVERISRDDRDGEVPSLAEQFEKRTGKKLTGQ